tara:strand:- start:319 stop:1254 length:936 start_codon:yes stop_codon:yes gene_type:complete
MALNALRDDMLRVHLDTTATVPAEEQLRFARAVLDDLHTMEGVGPDTVFTIHHLGHGSTLLEVIVTGLAAAAAVGTFGITLGNYLRNNQGEAAPQCSYIIHNYDGSRVTISTANEEPIFITREELPAPVDPADWLGKGTTFADGSGFSDGTGFASSTSEGPTVDSKTERSSADGLSRHEYTVFGILKREADDLFIQTAEGRLHVNSVLSNQELSLGIVGEFHISGPGDVMTSYDHDILNIKWRRDINLVRLSGRMVARHQGRVAEFETDDGSYSPHVPDDLLDWVPMGALVEVEGFFAPDGALHILDWEEL